MAFSIEFREALAIHGTSRGDRISLHTDNPGTTGAHEITGYAGYSRQTTVWNAGAVDGVVTGSEVTFEVPPGTTVSHIGCSSSSGAFQWGYALENPINFPGSLTVKITPKMDLPAG